VDVARDDRRRADPDRPGGRQRLARPCDAGRPRVPVGQQQDQARRLVHRGQVAMEERFEVPHRGRDPGGLLDLEGQLAGGRAIGPGPDGDDRSAAGQDRRDRLGAGLVGGPREEKVADEAAVGRAIGQLIGDGRRGHDRRQIADGVAPAVIHLDGGHDELVRRDRRGR
jgi:hypothetical protein